MARPVTHSLVKALGAVPGFDTVGDRDLLRIVGASVTLFWPAGSFVFEKDAPGEALYVVLSGQVRIFDVIRGQEFEIARVGQGDFFGEMSLLLDTMHTKWVQAVLDSELLVLPKRSFWELLDSNPDLKDLVYRKLDERRTETEVMNATERAAP